MVLRAILRNVQNTLVLLSAMLVVLAFQRLEHYEFQFTNFLEETPNEGSSYSRRSSSWDDSYPSIVRVGSHHQVVLGREFRIGLFRFFLPRLERTADEVTQPLTKPQEWEVRTSANVQYITDLRNQSLCQSLYLLDSAAILKESLPKKSTIHALMDSLGANESCNATNILTELGFTLVIQSSISSLSKRYAGCVESWQAFALHHLKHVDLVVHLPVTAIAVRPAATDAPSRRRHLRDRAFSSSVYSSSQTIKLFRPKESSSNNCSNVPTPCNSSPCPVSRLVALVAPPTRNCRLPWYSCNTSTVSSSACRVYTSLWRQRRRDFLELQHFKRNLSTSLELCHNGEYRSMY